MSPSCRLSPTLHTTCSMVRANPAAATRQLFNELHKRVQHVFLPFSSAFVRPSCHGHLREPPLACLSQPWLLANPAPRRRLCLTPPCRALVIEVQSLDPCFAWLYPMNHQPLLSRIYRRHPNLWPGCASPPWSTARKSSSNRGASTRDQRTQSNLKAESRVDLWTWLTGPYRARSNGLLPAH
jgi:hypothetical protein